MAESKVVLESALSVAVRASLPLAPAERPAFVSKHLIAQAEGGELPVGEGAHFNKDTVMEELEALSELLSKVVNVARKSPDWPLRAVALELSKAATPAPPPAAAPSAAAAAPEAATAEAAAAPAAEANLGHQGEASPHKGHHSLE